MDQGDDETVCPECGGGKLAGNPTCSPCRKKAAKAIRAKAKAQTDKAQFLNAVEHEIVGIQKQSMKAIAKLQKRMVNIDAHKLALQADLPAAIAALPSLLARDDKPVNPFTVTADQLAEAQRARAQREQQAAEQNAERAQQLAAQREAARQASQRDAAANAALQRQQPAASPAPQPPQPTMAQIEAHIQNELEKKWAIREQEMQKAVDQQWKIREAALIAEQQQKNRGPASNIYTLADLPQSTGTGTFTDAPMPHAPVG